MTEDEKREIELVLAQLRHAYGLMVCGFVKKQEQFANGLIAPQIRKLEKLISH